MLADVVHFEAEHAEGFPQILVHNFLVVDKCPKDDLQEQNVVGLMCLHSWNYIKLNIAFLKWLMVC